MYICYWNWIIKEEKVVVCMRFYLWENLNSKIKMKKEFSFLSVNWLKIYVLSNEVVWFILLN